MSTKDELNEGEEAHEILNINKDPFIHRISVKVPS